MIIHPDLKNIAVFMDRDGTINEEVGYLDDPGKFTLIPGSAEAIKKINLSGIKSVVVSNQSGVARGYLTEQLLSKIHEKMVDLLRAQGARLDGIYYCPHHPDFGTGPYRKICQCRKPAGGMLEKAAFNLKINLSSSYVVGDKLLDVELANGVGATGILVLTGYGKEELKKLTADNNNDKSIAYVGKDLPDAVEWILTDCRHKLPD